MDARGSKYFLFFSSLVILLRTVDKILVLFFRASELSQIKHVPARWRSVVDGSTKLGIFSGSEEDFPTVLAPSQLIYAGSFKMVEIIGRSIIKLPVHSRGKNIWVERVLRPMRYAVGIFSLKYISKSSNLLIAPISL